jgi:hypothetical protein
MAAINFIGGEKGGVGKSVVARLLAQYHIDRHLPFIGYDTDRSHGSLLRFYGDFAAPTIIDDYASLDQIVAAIGERPDRHVVVDLAAQTFPPLTRWIADSGVIEVLAEMQTPVRYWHVMDDSVDSVDMLTKLVATFGPSVSYVVVLNQGRGSGFTGFTASQARKDALAQHAAIIQLRGLHDGTMSKIDRGNTNFWAAASGQGAPGHALGILERHRVRLWLQKTYEDFDRIIAPATMAAGAASAG